MCCKNCYISEWFSNRPKPDCRIKYELGKLKNPVTIWVYRSILENRQNNKAVIECPFKNK